MKVCSLSAHYRGAVCTVAVRSLHSFLYEGRYYNRNDGTNCMAHTSQVSGIHDVLRPLV